MSNTIDAAHTWAVEVSRLDRTEDIVYQGHNLNRLRACVGDALLNNDIKEITVYRDSKVQCCCTITTRAYEPEK